MSSPPTTSLQMSSQNTAGNWWISAVANFLGIPKGTGEHGQSQALTSIVACIKTGFGGSRNRKNKQATGVQVADLKTQTNGTRVCYHFAAMAKRLPPLPLLWKHQSIFFFSFWPSIYPSIQSNDLSTFIHRSIKQPTHPTIPNNTSMKRSCNDPSHDYNPSTYPSTHEPCMNQSNHRSTHPVIHPFIHLAIYPSKDVSIQQYIHRETHCMIHPIIHPAINHSFQSPIQHPIQKSINHMIQRTIYPSTKYYHGHQARRYRVHQTINPVIHPTIRPHSSDDPSNNPYIHPSNHTNNIHETILQWPIPWLHSIDHPAIHGSINPMAHPLATTAAANHINQSHA